MKTPLFFFLISLILSAPLHTEIPQKLQQPVVLDLGGINDTLDTNNDSTEEVEEIDIEITDDDEGDQSLEAITPLVESVIKATEKRDESQKAAVKEVQTTFGLIKPNAIAAKHAGEILALIEKNGFDVVRMEKRMLTKKEAQRFYIEHKDKSFFSTLIEFMTSGPVVLLALKKENGINDWRELMGATNPAAARIGTIRRIYGTDVTRNAVHGSDSPVSAQRELQFFFGKI